MRYLTERIKRIHRFNEYKEQENKVLGMPFRTLGLSNKVDAGDTDCDGREQSFRYI